VSRCYQMKMLAGRYRRAAIMMVLGL
jgi:hypothetical protein